MSCNTEMSIIALMQTKYPYSESSSDPTGFFRFWHHRHRDGGGVNAALRLRGGHPLHPVYP